MANKMLNMLSLLNTTLGFLDDNFGFDNATNDLDDGFQDVVHGIRGNSSRPGHGGGNKTGKRPRKSGDDQLDCYECTAGCIYKLVQVIFVLGVVANLAVVWRTIVDKRLRTPTFVAIACLAFADSAFLSMNLIGSIIKVYNSLACKNVGFHMVRGIKPVLGVLWFASTSHVSILAGVRYILLMYPLKANVHLTKKRVLLASCGSWLLGCIIWTSMEFTEKLRTKWLQSGVWFVVFFSPLIITLVLHIVKWWSVTRAGRGMRTSEQPAHASITRMSNTLLLVIICAIALPFPRFLRENKAIIGELTPNGKVHLKGISNVLYLLNNSINPVFYALRSEQFKQSIVGWRHNLRKRISTLMKSPSDRRTGSAWSTNMPDKKTAEKSTTGTRPSTETTDSQGIGASSQTRQSATVDDYQSGP